MPYEVIGLEVGIQKALAFEQDKDGNTIVDDRETRAYIQGDVIPDEDVHPVVVKAYEDGDEHVRSLLKKISNAAAEAKAKEREEDSDGEE